jgi:phage/plasmid-associated DNA primase
MPSGFARGTAMALPLLQGTGLVHLGWPALGAAERGKGQGAGRGEPGGVRNGARHPQRGRLRRREASAIRPMKRNSPIRTIRALDFIVKWKGSGDNKTPVYWSDHFASTPSRARARADRLHRQSGEGLHRGRDPRRSMDRDRMAINVLNGTCGSTLERGNMPVLRLDPHQPEDLISKVANVAYDPDAVPGVRRVSRQRCSRTRRCAASCTNGAG